MLAHRDGAKLFLHRHSKAKFKLTLAQVDLYEFESVILFNAFLRINLISTITMSKVN